MRAVRRAVLAAAVTTGVVAAARRRTARVPEPGPQVPQQRRSGLDDLGLRVADLVVLEEDARDARLCRALDRASRTPGC